MQKSSFEFEILVHGSAAKEYYHKGSYYIEGKEGSRFSLRMRNSSNQKALFVPTVDGLSIMSGKEASFKSKGYIVDAYDSVTIDGWRTSDDNIAEFFFSSPKQSYAKKIDKGGNLGVIGCAVFKQKERTKIEYIPYTVYQPCTGHHHHWNTPCYSCNPSVTLTNTSTGDGSIQTSASLINISASASSNFLSQVSTPRGIGLGIGFGEDKYSPVITVDFEKEDSPSEVFSIYYNTRQNLESLGIEFRKVVYTSPSAFPSEDGYCPRP